MNQLELLKANLELELSQIPIDKDEFHRWKDLKVTRRFMLEMQIELMEERETVIGQCDFNTNEIALRTAQKEAYCEIMQSVIEWNPSEV